LMFSIYMSVPENHFCSANYVKPMFLCAPARLRHSGGYVVKEADETLVVKGAGKLFFLKHIEIHIEKAQKR
jgi:hypothetical protein